MQIDHRSSFKVGAWCATPTLNILAREGETSRLQPRAMDVLVYLAERAGEVVSSEELIAKVWQGRATESSVYQTINQLRQALGGGQDGLRYIQTVPKRGYHLIAQVTAMSDRPNVGELESTPSSSSPGARTPTDRQVKERRWGKPAFFAGTLAIVAAIVAIFIWEEPNDIESLAGLVDVTEPVPGFSNRAAIAVLPFVNLSGDVEQEYFSDGITEDIITELYSIGTFPVIARTSTFSYKGVQKDARDIAAELGAGYILEGSVRRTQDRVRITAQLIDASGTHVWGDSYDRDLGDIFQVQDEITQHIVGAMAPELLQVEISRADHVRTTDMEAWDYYLQAAAHAPSLGMGVTDRNGQPVTIERTELATTLAKKAIELDPSFADAHTLLGHTYYALSSLQRSKLDAASIEEILHLALSSTRRGYELNPYSATTCSCYVHFLGWEGPRDEIDLEAALRIQESAVDLNPSSAFARSTLAQAYQAVGRYDEALIEIHLAKRLSPRDVSYSYYLSVEALIYMSMGEWEDAIALAESAIALRRTNFYAHVTKTVSHYARGEHEVAYLAVDELLQANPDFSPDMLWYIPVPASLLPIASVLERTEPIANYPQMAEAVIETLQSDDF